VNGIVGVLLGLIVVSTFLLPSYVGKLYSEDGQQPPITGWGGFWAFIPLIGSFIWVAKIQGGLNRFWEQKSAAFAPAGYAAAPAVPAPAVAPPPPQAPVQPPPVAAQPQMAPPPTPAPVPPPVAPAAPPRAAGPPLAPLSATATPFLVFKDGPLAGRRFPIETQVVLGREKTDIVVDDPEVSRQHALMRWVEGRLELSDLRSANGTFVNGRRLDQSGELHDGDVVKIGMTSILVEVPVARDPGATVVSPR
jgi:hypothetical protein